MITLGFHYEYAVIRWIGNYEIVDSLEQAEEYFNIVSGCSVYRMIVWKPRIQFKWWPFGWRQFKYREWPEKGDPPWWSDRSLLAHGWLNCGLRRNEHSAASDIS